MPVLVTVAVTFKFSNPSTLTLGVEVLTAKLWSAETAIAEATMATREARREEKSIVMQGVRGLVRPRLDEPGLSSLPVFT